jgi:hypothetical protein
MPSLPDSYDLRNSNRGVGIVIYYRKDRSRGNVKKYMVYNNLKRQEGGYLAGNYFKCTRKVVGVQDTRFQAISP